MNGQIPALWGAYYIGLPRTVPAIISKPRHTGEMQCVEGRILGTMHFHREGHHYWFEDAFERKYLVPSDWLIANPLPITRVLWSEYHSGVWRPFRIEYEPHHSIAMEERQS